MKNAFIIVCMLLVFSVPGYAVKVYPNPWIPDSKTDNDRHGNYITGIKFDNLSASGGTIYIYNVTGELVRRLDWASGKTEENWDGRNNRSEYVGSGIYIWVIKDGGTKSGKIVVIR
ncbi:MAG: T9SS type A sorting domain-containing protein [Endomicrobium sp.]|jgi:flagellar hook assembly protein FlgD|nr:T9SS type A sorting domain-containing protein [Endomicrobium sp.]